MLHKFKDMEFFKVIRHSGPIWYKKYGKELMTKTLNQKIFCKMSTDPGLKILEQGTYVFCLNPGFPHFLAQETESSSPCSTK
jgi:hypothetical protein